MIHLWSQTLAVARRILLELWRRQRSLLFWSVFPVAVLLLNGLIYAERAREELNLAQAFERAGTATLVGAALFFSCLGGSVATIVAEREQRTLRRLFLTPLQGVAYFLGIFFAHGAIALWQTLLVAAIATLFGAQMHGSYLLAAGILLLSVLAYVGVGFLLGSQFARRTEDVNALVAAFGVPLLILGGAFVPSRIFPPALVHLAHFNPVYHMNEALTKVVAEGLTVADLGMHLRVLIGFALLMVASGWLAYRQMLNTEQRL